MTLTTDIVFLHSLVFSGVSELAMTAGRKKKMYNTPRKTKYHGDGWLTGQCEFSVKSSTFVTFGRCKVFDFFFLKLKKEFTSAQNELRHLYFDKYTSNNST